MPFPEPASSLIVLAVGPVFGSFLNVCIYRLPMGQSIAFPGSRCPSCFQAIRWYQNIPVLSWLLLRGRCANCGVSISWRYPFVEALSGALVLALWLDLGGRAAFPVAAGFALAMVVLFFTDLDHKILPDAITLSGWMVGIAISWFNPFLVGSDVERVGASLIGAGVGAGLLWALGAIYTRLRGVEAMGMGDVKMMAMVGAFAGPAAALLTIFAGSLVGAVYGLLAVPLRGRSLKDTLPFGCFLAPAALVGLLWGRPLVEAYLRIVVPPI